MEAQAWYYLLGGLWSLLNYSSFEGVVGTKRARLQTEVTAVLFAAIRAALLAGARRAPMPPTPALSADTAAALLAMDWRYRRNLHAVLKGEAIL